MNDDPVLDAAGLRPATGWIETVQRIATPPPARRGLVFSGLSLAARAFGRAEVPDIFSVFHLNARLFWPWLWFASRLMPGGRLPAREREQLILRTAWLTRSLYEWGQHVDIGLRVGLSDADILRVAQGPEHCADPAERLLLQACDELVRERQVADQTWAALAQRYDERRLIEIVILVGHYVMVAGFLNSAGLKLEPPIAQKLEAFHQRLIALSVPPPLAGGG
ncbi:MAG: carboxymuconolactone decarboxylase family protein [Nevskia sp.]|nr:carboxymuconolactone decarboxylase family protein [Nevskia sp.]